MTGVVGAEGPAGGRGWPPGGLALKARMPSCMSRRLYQARVTAAIRLASNHALPSAKAPSIREVVAAVQSSVSQPGKSSGSSCISERSCDGRSVWCYTCAFVRHGCGLTEGLLGGVLRYLHAALERWQALRGC